MQREENKGRERIPRAALKKIVEALGSVNTKEDLEKLKSRVARECSLKRIPLNSEILNYLKYANGGREGFGRGKRLSPSDWPAEDKLIRTLITKPTRSISGEVSVAVMWLGKDNFSCPGDCIYCPQLDNVPKSYTGKEPAARRALRLGYDPFKQVNNRLKQLEEVGHPVDKVNLIVMGGTFTAASERYQEQFLKGCFDALNEKGSKTLEGAHKLNERARRRLVGLTIESRPDYCSKRIINHLLDMGATRMELGVQTLSDKVYKLIKRKHCLNDVVEATQRLKDSGFKVAYHMMLGLPGEGRNQDVKKFERLFEDQKFRPDELKIYPTAVLEGTKLFELYKRGEYKALDEKDIVRMLIEIKSKIPEYVRVKRVIRDIPSTEISAGSSRTNLRQVLDSYPEKKCRCIRCREAGHVFIREGRKPKAVEKVVRSYKASRGEELFISYEDVGEDILVAYLRLRLPHRPFKPELEDAVIVRELKVLGPTLGIGKRGSEIRGGGNIYLQHKGLGKGLMHTAERIVEEKGYKRLAVISAVGVRPYYAKLGYKRCGAYMVKAL